MTVINSKFFNITVLVLSECNDNSTCYSNGNLVIESLGYDKVRMSVPNKMFVNGFKYYSVTFYKECTAVYYTKSSAHKTSQSLH